MYKRFISHNRYININLNSIEFFLKGTSIKYRYLGLITLFIAITPKFVLLINAIIYSHYLFCLIYSIYHLFFSNYSIAFITYQFYTNLFILYTAALFPINYKSTFNFIINQKNIENLVLLKAKSINYYH